MSVNSKLFSCFSSSTGAVRANGYLCNSVWYLQVVNRPGQARPGQVVNIWWSKGNSNLRRGNQSTTQGHNFHTFFFRRPLVPPSLVAHSFWPCIFDDAFRLLRRTVAGLVALVVQWYHGHNNIFFLNRFVTNIAGGTLQRSPAKVTGYPQSHISTYCTETPITVLILLLR